MNRCRKCERNERQDNVAKIERKITVRQGTRRSTTLFAAAMALAMLREKLIKIGATVCATVTISRSNLPRSHRRPFVTAGAVKAGRGVVVNLWA